MIVKTFVTGQLCNQIYDFSTFYAEARSRNEKLIYYGLDEYLSYFPLAEETLQKEYNFRIKKKVGGELIRRTHKLFETIYRSISLKINNPLFYSTIKNSTTDTEILDLNAKLKLIGGNWFTSHNKVNQFRNELKLLFTPKEPYLSNINKLVSNYRKQFDVLVGIHIRKGDYEYFKEGKYNYGFEVYARIAKEMQVQLVNQKVGFVLCSNSYLPKEPFKNLPILNSTGHFIEDLYTLAGCDYLIGPPSTFSMWASFYGRVPLFQVYSKDIQLDLSQFIIYDVY